VENFDRVAAWRWGLITLAAMLIAYPILVLMNHESFQPRGFLIFAVFMTLFRGFLTGYEAVAWQRPDIYGTVQLVWYGAIEAMVLAIGGDTFNVSRG